MGRAAALLLLASCATKPSADSACQAKEVAFDECGTLGDEVAARTLVLVHGPFAGLTGDTPRTLTTQAELESFWSESGLAGAGEPIPSVDFAAEQAIAFENSAGDSCDDDARVRAVYAAAAGGGALVARIDVEDRCPTGSCADTAAYPLLLVWAIPRGELTTCRAGTRCEVCP